MPADPFAEDHPATIRLPEDRRRGSDGTVVIQPFVLPHRNKVTSDAEWRKMGLQKGHMRSQGFYLYRNRRLIQDATWFNLAARHRLTELARIRLDIGNESDAAWGIDVLKASAAPPASIRNHLRKLVDGLGGQSKQAHRRRGARLTDDNPLPLWQRTKADGVVSYSLNLEHPVLAALQASLPLDRVRDFEGAIRHVAAALPLEALHHDMAEGLDSIAPSSLPEEEILASGQMLVKRLREIGREDGDIALLLGSIPPYAGATALIAKLLGET
jgi:hypothetical protein